MNEGDGQGSTEGEIVPYSNPKELAELMDQPYLRIAETITGMLKVGKFGILQSSGRILQGAIQGKFVKQFAQEIRMLADEGKIKDDYTDKYGFQSLTELLNFIDSEAPDEERLNAIKGLFFNIISIDSLPENELKNYQLFQIAKKLSAPHVIILKAAYERYKRNPDSGISSADVWFRTIANDIGHKNKYLIMSEDQNLIDLFLLTDRIHSDGSGVEPRNCRLTDLGIEFCEGLEAGEELIKS